MQNNSSAMYVRLCAFGAFLLVGGIIGTVGVMIGEARMNATATWPSVPGRIIVSEVATAVVRTGPVWSRQPIAKVHFAYAIQGRTFEGEGLRVAPMLHTEPEGTPAELVSRYPVGKAVEVYYDPENPRDSLLIPRASAKARQFTRSLNTAAGTATFIGLLIVVVGGVCVYRSRFAAPSDAVEQSEVSTAPPTPALDVASATPVKPRTTHWIIRTAATVLGIVFLLFGSLLFLASLKTNNPSVSATVEIVARCIFFGVALLGGGLVYFGMRR